MIFSIKFINLKLNSDSFETLHTKVIELSPDCMVHDCNTDTGFTMQIKPRDFKVKGRLELKSTYDQTNTLIIGIEKEFQTQWSLDKMEQLVKDLETFDQEFK